MKKTAIIISLLTIVTVYFFLANRQTQTVAPLVLEQKKPEHYDVQQKKKMQKLSKIDYHNEPQGQIDSGERIPIDKILNVYDKEMTKGAKEIYHKKFLADAEHYQNMERVSLEEYEAWGYPTGADEFENNWHKEGLDGHYSIGEPIEMSDGELDETMVNALSTQIKEEEGTEPTEDQINEVIAKENRKVQDINMKLAEHQEEIARLYSNGKEKEAQELMTKLTAEAQEDRTPWFPRQ